jgi:RimJ/RimL family protein N-acetyltransferase
MTVLQSAWVAPVTLHDPQYTPTIRLEPLAPQHAPELYAAADPELFRFTMQAPDEWSPAGFEAEARWTAALPGTLAFAILLAATGRAIGRTTFMDIKPEHRGLEIGRTWIGRAWQGTRVNPEAKFLMLRHAFEALVPTAIRVQLTTNGNNLHSQAAIAKLGAVREGLLRQARIMPPGLDRSAPEPRDWVVYSILDSEWPGVKARLEQRLTAW